MLHQIGDCKQQTAPQQPATAAAATSILRSSTLKTHTTGIALLRHVRPLCRMRTALQKTTSADDKRAAEHAEAVELAVNMMQILMHERFNNYFCPPCRKKKAVHKTTSTDDKRLQNTLKRLGVNTIPGIEEVNIFQGDDVINFTNPKGEQYRRDYFVNLS